MVKIVSSKISDPRPRMNVALESDDGKTLANIIRGYVNIQRGPKTAILRMPVGELSGMIDVLTEAKSQLEANGYSTTEGSNEPMAAPTTRAGKHADEPAVEVPDDASSIPEAANPFAQQQ